MRATIVSLAVLLIVTTIHSASAQKKAIPLGVKVEAEGGGHSQGMWTQVATDLTSSEAKALESLVVVELEKQTDIRIVPMSYSEDFIGIAVVGAKLPIGTRKNGWHYILSSAVIVSKKDGTDELLTHDVIAGDDLESVARTIAYQFATTRLRAATGLWK